jgi:hypothetical protein
MTKRLTIALAAGALAVAMLPGAGAAKGNPPLPGFVVIECPTGGTYFAPFGPSIPAYLSELPDDCRITGTSPVNPGA